MTYFGFLLRFLAVPILVLVAITYWDKAQMRCFRSGRAIWIAIGIHVLLAVVYTTPWDNYLVATGVWYYNPQLVTGLVIGYVPVEEYTFFVLETILAGLWWLFLARRISLPAISPAAFHKSRLLTYASALLLLLVWFISVYLVFFGHARWTYFSIILFWALPAIILQALFGADILWHYRKLVFWGVLIPALYLSLMDILALQATTWSISPSQTTGLVFFGILPMEEALFFFTTNILLTFGMTLLLARLSQDRFARIVEKIKAWREWPVPDPGSY